jgi:tetratricopeptide (TPR) repeat protein
VVVGGGYFGTTTANTVDGDRNQDIALFEEALETLGGDDSELRARLLASLSSNLVYTPLREQRHRLSREAIEMALRLNDKEVLCHALAAGTFAINDPLTLTERIVRTDELETLANDLGKAEERWVAAYHRASALLESGDVEGGERMIARMYELAAQLRQPYFAWQASSARAMVSIMRGAPDAERQAFATFEVGTAAEQPDAGTTFGAQFAQIRFDQGRFGELIDVIRASAEAQPHIPGWRAGLAYVYCETDQLDEARKVLESFAATGFAIPLNWTSATQMLFLASACANVHDRNAAALLYPLLKPVAGQVAMVANTVLCLGSFAYPCGLLATCLERWEEAEQYLEQALAMNAKFGARPYLVRTRCGYATMLLDRNAPGDMARAADLIDAGLAEAQRLGMDREVVRFGRLQERLR